MKWYWFLVGGGVVFSGSILEFHRYYRTKQKNALIMAAGGVILGMIALVLAILGFGD